MNRRQFAISSAALCTTTALTTRTARADSVSEQHEPVRFEVGQPAEFLAESTPVLWQEQEFKLVKLNQATFHFDEDSYQLKATVQGAIITFDDVDYDLGLCVFDHDRTLLGVSKLICKVPRIWLGRFLTQKKTFEFDFGVSKAFARADSFLLSISDRNVLTPDDWQK